ncbi:hypothetical protein I6F48_00270 [Pseudoalteromonas sp. SWYJ118]|uniref:hypothetical protein n=1 Tax=Pseudoalteromonas sp. SWYJ118 TaxID=2792062 RepID=UPI0018CCBFEC|nr:hypothetical protein [Pseudoalteromonas sp. SWYJ118]MBH0073998.1 hypothetical protein [Pseudoalteromonas sp. SWYJ118]
MKKYLLVIIILSMQSAYSVTSRSESLIAKMPSGVYYKYELITLSNNTKTVNYSCFTAYPNNPHINGSQDYLALGYKKGNIGLSPSMEKICQSFIAINNEAGMKK